MSSDEASLQVDLAEYNALRAEIQTFLNLQSAFLGLAVAIIAALIPVAASKDAVTALPWIIAATPLPFAILATLYADVIARIGRVARYIQTTLQPRLAKQTNPSAATGENDTLGWERYVHKDDPNKKLLWATDKIRYAIFFLPAILAYYASFWWPMSEAYFIADGLSQRWDLYFKITNGIALVGASIVVWRSESVIRGIHRNRKAKHARSH